MELRYIEHLKAYSADLTDKEANSASFIKAIKKAGFAWYETYQAWLIQNLYRVYKVCYHNENIYVSSIPRAIQNFKSFLNNSYRQNVEFDITSSKDLKPFQKAGVMEMVKRKNVLLADEQGLGKTIQVVTFINLFKNLFKNIVIVCPSSLKINWARELHNWANLDCFIVKKQKDSFVGKSNITILSYDVLKSLNIQDQLEEHKPSLLICDEAHYLKNGNTKRTKVLKKISKLADKIILMTGTPLLNRPTEVYSLLRILGIDPFVPYYNYKEFAMRYCEQYNNMWGLNKNAGKNIEELGKTLRASHMIRRLKKDVLPQLPRKIFKLIVLENDAVVRKLQDDAKCYIPQIGIHEMKDLRTPENTTKLKKAGGVARLSALRRQIAHQKTPESISIIKDMLENVDKIVVFVYHIKILSTIFDGLKDYKPVHFNGSMSAKTKQKAVDDFQNKKDVRVFVGQIQAAGVGLTLTAANDVVFVESSWVPGEINQAIDRCHRIGQLNPVTATFLVVDGTIDHVMLEAVVKKEKTICETLNQQLLT